MTADAESDSPADWTSGPGGPGARRSWRMPALFGAVGLLVLALDQLTKVLALHYLEPGDPVDVIGSLLRFQLIRNSGAAFSLGSDYTPVISVVQISVAAAVVWLSRRLGSTGWAVAFGLLFGGAVGNITDRIFREPSPFHGHVVDFLQLPHWAIFNVADMAVSAAAVLLVVQTLRGVRLDGTRDGESRDGGPADVTSHDGASHTGESVAAEPRNGGLGGGEPRNGGSDAAEPPRLDHGERGDAESRDAGSGPAESRDGGSRGGGSAAAAAQ